MREFYEPPSESLRDLFKRAAKKLLAEVPASGSAEHVTEVSASSDWWKQAVVHRRDGTSVPARDFFKGPYRDVS